MIVGMNETILYMTAETLNEAAIVGMIRATLQAAREDAAFGVPQFDDGEDENLHDLHIEVLHEKAATGEKR